ncbi:hypothetical protein [uncultured Parolsenella sp.]|uniref:hypothetical protein n=1 Tax=uncultured Parolsenella sp. TaxID=2083008 RepID=UPI0025F6707D|nr:hypothetical protein [uncultured Parolsenella sp.]
MSGQHGGITLMGALAVLLIGLRLAGLIDWPWWAVLLPMWGPLALVALLVLVIAVLEIAIDAAKK